MQHLVRLAALPALLAASALHAQALPVPHQDARVRQAL